MTTRLVLATVISVATLTVGSYIMARTSQAGPPGPAGAGLGSCVGTLYGDVCTVSIYFGPSCVVTATGAMQCRIPLISETPNVVPPYQKCFAFKNSSGANYGICDVIPDNKTRCVISYSGQIQCLP